MYKNIPIITFEAELKFMYPHGKLKHLMEVGKIKLYYSKSNFISFKYVFFLKSTWGFKHFPKVRDEHFFK